ncbi:hypothetical protein [Lutimonas vermicola]|uniref:WD40-like Beta Propeller Repeat n=1 Tax=Lutimonas vermicola TaxID=414288 RepID=A0ABU9L2X3_9FLAO
MISLTSQVLWCQRLEKVEPAFTSLSKFENIRDFTLASSGDEAYFTLQSPNGEISAIMHIKKTKEEWSEPFIASFSGNYQDIEPFLSPDNLRLYFASNRPLKNTGDEVKDYDIWYVSRQTLSAEWDKPVNLGSPVNSEKNEFYPSLSDNMNLYFTSNLSTTKGKDDIFLSKWDGDMYQEPISLSESINTEGYEFNAFVSPDESFLIFTGFNRPDGLGSGDLYISFNKGSGWQPSVNLGNQVNSDEIDYCPFVDMNSNTLYFTSKRSNLTSNRAYQNLEELLKEFSGYENGQSRLYKVKINNILSSGMN